MRRAIGKYSKDFIAIILLGVVAAGVGGYVLSNQRLRFPFSEKPFKLKAAFSTAQAVTPGQGQTLRISGIRVGDIAKVDLVDGKAVITFDVDQKYASMIHSDATALLRPKTGLKDMFVELEPGSTRAPRVKEGWTVPVSNTLPDVNPDEIFSALDGDTRDYLQLLVDGAGRGLHGRGGDLREVLRRFEPTHRDLARVTSAVAVRRTNLRRLVHSLNLLNTELAGKDDELAQLVDSASTVFRSFASQDVNISRTLRDLPPTLRQTTGSLRKLQTFANVLRPTATDLIPTAKALDKANRAVRPFAKEATPIIKNDIRPFVRQSRPLVRSLRPASENLAKSTPDLTRSFVVLNHLFNLLGFNQDGREGPDKASRDEGYLFWIAWLQHNGAAVFSTADAHGSLRPVSVTGTCTAIKASIDEQFSSQLPPAAATFLSGLTGVVTDPNVCGAVTAAGLPLPAGG